MTYLIDVPTKLTVGDPATPVELTVSNNIVECSAMYLKKSGAYYEGYDEENYVAYDNFLWEFASTFSASETYAFCVSGEMKNSTDFSAIEATANGQEVEIIRVDDYYFHFFMPIGTTDASGNISADTADYLDSTTTSKDYDQNYTLTVVDDGYTDVTKVKVEWTINDITVSRTDSKVWDPDNLEWKEVKEASVTNNGSATFIITNYSSIEIDAQFTFSTEFNPTVSYSDNVDDDYKVTVDTVVGDAHTVAENPTAPSETVEMTVEPDPDDFKSLSATTGTKYGTYTVTISKHTKCLAKGTKITMANGTLKNVEDVTAGEKVLTFNHETGEYEAQAVYLAYAGKGTDNGTKLTFSDGTTLTIVGEHDLFEKESMKYVTLTRNNANANVGKHYYNAETGKFVELTSVQTTSPVNYYSLYTNYNSNCIANGMLTVPDDVDYMLNFYEFNDDLTANATKLQEDIATYGIYQCRADASYTEAEYETANMKYLNIVVGKGLMTWEGIIASHNEYLELR